jgi:hypothetical protein
MTALKEIVTDLHPTHLACQPVQLVLVFQLTGTPVAPYVCDVDARVDFFVSLNCVIQYVL